MTQSVGEHKLADLTLRERNGKWLTKLGITHNQHQTKLPTAFYLCPLVFRSEASGARFFFHTRYILFLSFYIISFCALRKERGKFERIITFHTKKQRLQYDSSRNTGKNTDTHLLYYLYIQKQKAFNDTLSANSERKYMKLKYPWNQALMHNLRTNACKQTNHRQKWCRVLLSFLSAVKAVQLNTWQASMAIVHHKPHIRRGGFVVGKLENAKKNFKWENRHRKEL